MSMDGLEEMPIWAPPTPPQDDADVYIDFSLAHLYDTRLMDESALPPVYVKKELKRPRKESISAPPDDGRRPAKIMRKEETVYAPRSLFDRPSPALAKLRRDLKMQRFRGIVRPPVPIPNLNLKAPTLAVRPAEEAENTPEWLVHEDWILLQAVQNLLELPLNLVILTPAHTPNWDLVADMVNSYSRTYRSPKQCRTRYLSVILPREEGKATVDNSPKKIKKGKSMSSEAGTQQPSLSTKGGNRPLRTAQLFLSDNNSSYTSVWHQKFETLKSIVQKKAPTNRSLLSGSSAIANRGATNTKHAGVLQEAGISYDAPLNPVQVAAVRAERIAQKQKQAVEQAQAQQQQQVQQQRLTAGASSSAATTSGTPNSPAMAIRNPPTPSQPSGTAATATTSAASANSQAVTSNPTGAVGTTTLGQQTLLLQGNAAASVQGPTTAQQVVLQPGAGAARAQRPIGTLTVQEVPSGGSPVRGQQQQGTIVTGSPSTGQTVVTVGNLTAVQVQAAAQMLASAGIAVSGTSQLSTVTTTTAAGLSRGAAVTVVQTSGTTVVSPAIGTKTLTPTQIQYFRQQALAKQQQQRLQEQQLKKLQLVTAAGGLTAAGTAAGGSAQLAAVGTTASGQKVPIVGTVATTLSGTTSALGTIGSVQLAGQSQATGRTHLLKGSAAATALLSKGGTALAKAIVADSEVAALIKRQHLQQQQLQQKAAAAGAAGAQGSTSQAQTVQIGTASNATGITAQLLAQAGLQVQTAPAASGQAQVATLVKTVSTPGAGGGAPSVTIPVSAISVGLPQVKGLTAASVKGSSATQQQLRQLTIQHQLLQRKAQQQQAKTGQLAQTVTLGTVKGNVVGVPAQQLATAVGTVQVHQLVQPVGTGSGATGTASAAGSASKAVSTTVTMQQLQQVIRQVTAGNAQVLVSSPNSGAAGGTSGTGVIGKNAQGQTVQARVIPVPNQGLKQTIQVVTAGQAGQSVGATRVATLSATGTGGTVSPSLASALASGAWKVTDPQQKALLSQVSAALQSGQPVSLAVRAGPNSSGTTRILTTGATFTSIASSIASTVPATAVTSAIRPNTSTTTTATPSASTTTSAIGTPSESEPSTDTSGS